MALIFDVKVIPSSGKNDWVLNKEGQLKCYLKSPPENGLANKELIKIIAKQLHIPQQEVSIIAGKTSRRKKIQIQQDLTYEQLLHKLGIEQQMSMFNA